MTAEKTSGKRCDSPLCTLCQLPISQPVASGGRMYEHIKSWESEKLRIVHDFFDCDRLRQHYTGLIADIRAELDRRGGA